MLQIAGDTEQKSVAESGIVHLRKQFHSQAITQLKSTTSKNASAQIHAEPHCAVLIHVAMPRQVVLRTGRHAVDPTAELADLLAVGDDADYVQKSWVIQK